MIDSPTLAFLAMAGALPLLWKGADWLVTGSSRLARRLGWSDLTIGLTVVAFGTSAPELVVTIGAALTGAHDISVGNVVGSNIFNTGIILGSCAAIWCVPAAPSIVRRDLPMLLLATACALWFAHDLSLQRNEGVVLVVGLFAYLLFLLRTANFEYIELEDGAATPVQIPDPLLVVIGLVCIASGAHLMVEGASSLARASGWPDWLIGVTLVAAGTSLPELVTAIAAARRGNLGLLFGNLVGSDLFNLLGVLGVAIVIQPMHIDPSARIGLAMMLAAVALLWGLAARTSRLSRLAGVLLIAVALLRWARDVVIALAS